MHQIIASAAYAKVKSQKWKKYPEKIFPNALTAEGTVNAPVAP
ncbi:MAG: hypothetical protein RMY34_00330 [Aulosira sp. DedQUE10]|nr:hypothetical protein [Aulosira sp. DedQUE10]